MIVMALSSSPFALTKTDEFKAAELNLQIAEVLLHADYKKNIFHKFGLYFSDDNKGYALPLPCFLFEKEFTNYSTNAKGKTTTSITTKRIIVTGVMKDTHEENNHPSLHPIERLFGFKQKDSAERK